MNLGAQRERERFMVIDLENIWRLWFYRERLEIRVLERDRLWVRGFKRERYWGLGTWREGRKGRHIY